MNMTRQDILDVADLIQGFVDGTCGPYDWDDFLNGSEKSSELQRIRHECERVEIDYPARSVSEWCSPEGADALMTIATRLRDEVARSVDQGSKEGTNPNHQKKTPNK
jgi:hypothetical protein